MGMYTDPDHLRVEDPGKVEGNMVFVYLDVFATEEHFKKYLPEYNNLDELKEHYKRGGLGDVKIKLFLNNVLQDILRPIRTRREELSKDMDKVIKILIDGSEKARKRAQITVDQVKDAMGINYFGE